MKKIFLGVYHPSVILTYIGVLISLWGIFFSQSLYHSTVLLILAGLCDTFDGMFARRYKRSGLEERFGVEIDSLADLVSFGILPAKMYMLYFYRNGYIAFILISAYLLSVIIRLAYFNATSDEDRMHFTGLAVTYSAFFLSAYIVAGKCVGEKFLFPIECIYIFLTFGFLWNRKIKKPNLYIRLIFLILAVLFIAALLL